MDAEIIVSEASLLIRISFHFSTTENDRTESHLTKSDRRGQIFWILEMRPCPSLGPHAGDGWTCTNARLAAGHESNGIWKKRTAIMAVMSRLEND